MTDMIGPETLLLIEKSHLSILYENVSAYSSK